MGLGQVTPEEIFNVLLELEVSRTEVALRTYVHIRRSQKNFRARPVEGHWSRDRGGEYRLIIKVRALFEKDDYQEFINRCTGICSGEMGFSCTLFVLVGIHDNPSDRVRELEKRGLSQRIREIFKDTESDEIIRFLLRDTES
jgi:hypothetical protein